MFSDVPKQRGRLIFVAVLPLLALVFVCGIPAQSAPPCEIKSLRLDETATGMDLVILASAPITWKGGFKDGGVVLRLSGCLPGPRLSGFDFGEGLVAAVEVDSNVDSRLPETRITIRSRDDLTYSVSAKANELTVHLRSLGASSREQIVDSSPTPGSDSLVEDLSEEYQIGPGDVLEVDVFGLEDFDRKVRVLGDGTITLPLLGTLSVSHLSLQEAESRIARILSERELVSEPQVSIFVSEFVSRAVSVQGAVGQPGTYQLLGRKTLLDMIGQAGGMNDRVGQNILVLRKAADGRQQKIEIDAARLVEQGDPASNILLRPGDVVMVPHDKRLRVYVTGAVGNPGAVEFLSSERITVLQAITAASGPSNRANLKKVHVLRRQPDGTQERIAVNIKKIQKGKEDDFFLQKDDTVVVGEWFF